MTDLKEAGAKFATGGSERTSGRLNREGEVTGTTEAQYPFRNPMEYRRWVGKESERSYPVKDRLLPERCNFDSDILSGAEM